MSFAVHATDKEIVERCNKDDTLSLIRKEIHYFVASCEQAEQQRTKPTPIQLRRMEFASAERILTLVKTKLLS